MSKFCRLYKKSRSHASFTLVEMLVTVGILVIVLGILLQLTTQISKVWQSSNSRIQTFQEARTGFEAMTRRLGQATLNTYYDYYQTNSSGVGSLRTTANSSTFTPNTYDRVSELHFVSGQLSTLLPSTMTNQTHSVFFQTPAGYSVQYQQLDNALNACGYFLQFGSATSSVPNYVANAVGYKPRYRYRLMEMMQPTEGLGVYYGAPTDWFVNNVTSNSRIVAENVIALVLLPKLTPTEDPTGTALAPKYNYDSRIGLGATSDTNWTGASSFPGDSFTTTTSTGTTVTLTRHNQLPPLMHVVMIVIDEPSAIRLQGGATTAPSALNFSTLFTDATKLASDIQTVEDVCNAKAGNLTGNTIPLNYRIFASDVIMRDSKWSNK